MDYGGLGGPSLEEQAPPHLEGQFDIVEWVPYYQSCMRYFLDVAQYEPNVQTVAVFLNIQLPFQKPIPVTSFAQSGSPPAGGPGHGPGPRFPQSARAAGKMPAVSMGFGHLPQVMHAQQQPGATVNHVSALPYLRRLIVTGFDRDGILLGFFGEKWREGIGHWHECERRNYLFAAKSDNWHRVKMAYDMSDDQTVPYMRPLRDVSEREIEAAESTWSEWLAMQDWMLGPRAPEGGIRIKREEEQ